MSITLERFETLPYILQLPENYEKGRRYPILLNLHGAGTRGITLEEYAQSPMFDRFAEHMQIEPFITVAPHCTAHTWFDRFETLIRLAQLLPTLPFADPDRIYLMGTSMGGYGAWQLGMSHPELFAALLPICGGGMRWNVSRLVNVPVWAFHGGKDTVVFPEESIKLVERLQEKGANAKLTIYPENGHDAWNDTFKNPEVFAWMLAQRRHCEKELQDECKGRAQFG
ncbi:MAG: prolyl oligopeptidase family serine peptidase [Clostridia bacterium]|nr:prolyl oligopeptidase family serine peptidase [Clostridia bacterium]